MPSRRHVVFLTAATAAVAAGLVPGRGQNKTQDRLRAVATFSILGDFVRNGDVHVYAPTPSNVRAIAAANIVFVNGLGLEGWMDRLIAASATRAPVVVASRGITPRRRTRAQDHAASDPHAWQSVANAKVYVGNIRDGLIAVDATAKEIYETNATAYLAMLDAVDGEIKAAIAAIPSARRRVITTHSAFGYFGDAYGVEFIAPEGLSTDAEPSARDIAKLIEQIRRENFPALFLENIADSRLLQQIAEDTGVRIGGKLYSDALSPPDEPAATYIAMMRSNVRELTRALTS